MNIAVAQSLEGRARTAMFICHEKGHACYQAKYWKEYADWRLKTGNIALKYDGHAYGDPSEAQAKKAEDKFYKKSNGGYLPTPIDFHRK